MAIGRKTGGRVKGVPNKTTQSIRDALTTAFDKLGGVPSLVKWGRANETEFYRLWGRLAPQEVTGKDGGPLAIRVHFEDPPAS